MTTEELRKLLEVLKEYKINEYKTAELHITFNSAAFYNPPKEQPVNLESSYVETF